MTSFQDTPQANHLLVNSGVNRWSFNLRKWRNQTRSTRGQSRGVAQVGKKLVEWSLSIWSDIWRKNMLHGSVSPKGACTICLWNGCNFMVNVLYFVCFIYSGISLIRNSEPKSFKIAENTSSQAKGRQFTEGTCTYLPETVNTAHLLHRLHKQITWAPCGETENNPRDYGIDENLGRDYGIEEPGGRSTRPLFLDQTEARLSERLDPPLLCIEELIWLLHVMITATFNYYHTLQRSNKHGVNWSTLTFCNAKLNW